MPDNGKLLFGAGSDLKILHDATNSSITNETGEQGWGQVSTYHSDITCQVLHRQVAPWVLGLEFFDLDDLLDLVTEREHKFPGSYLRRAIGGFDTAVWDLWGKQAGKPVVALLGGKPGKLRVYASSMKRDITPVEEAERLIALQQKFGSVSYTHLTLPTKRIV